ncbi:hypothetical protein [Nocardia pseudovaccinii]|uniref:hypothetical protein n=1 Tax=Nocardia pseudovaccinii TaxID=189540 RepID=UPI0007A43248|nr:hypothetical protein [Nocardia pseudovaccinii]
MGFLGLDLKDIVVTAVSVVPGVGAPLAGLTDAVWTGVEEHSLSKGLQAGATTWAMSSIPGGKLAGGLLAKVGGPIAEKLASKAASDSLIGKGFDWVANHSVTMPNKWYLPKSGKTFGGLAPKAVGRSASRATGRAMGAYAGSRLDEAGWWPGNGGGGGGADKSVTISTRPAGADMSGNYYGAKDSKAVIGAYDADGKSQQPWPVSA